jgi:hypothetical protein
MGNRILMIFEVLLCSVAGMAQDTIAKINAFRMSGFAEAYYSYDFNRPENNNRPSFIYSHNRHNEFNINLAFIKCSYDGEMARARVALAAGTYMNANYAAEPVVLKSIMETSVGVKLLKNSSLWIEAGIFPSHIGFESAVSSDCRTLTRSIMAENSPYFEAGAKLTYTSHNEKWTIATLALNGWQRIQRLQGNSLMSWGMQLQYKPSEKLCLNYSNFIGADSPDSSRRWRYFHDLYVLLQFNSKLGMAIGFDIGQQQEAMGSSRCNTWYGSSAILRFIPGNNWAMALRGEFYKDANAVIISATTPNGFNTYGASVNIDRTIAGVCFWRTEIRTLYSRDAIFLKSGSGTTHYNTAITSSLAFTLK